MSSLKSRQDIMDWLASAGIDRLVIVSPHLDDAVLSLGGLIAAVPEITEIVTVHTEGARELALDWARKGGFTDPIQEHEARRREDHNAMEYLGCRFRHLGVQSGELSEAVALQHVQTLWGSSGQDPASTLFLLPAGAGGDRPLSATKTWVRRILRRPFGATAHPEHERTRDQFRKALSAIDARLGFYAEIPYVWNEAPTRLLKRLSKHYSSPLETVRITPDLSDKLTAAGLYRSQAKLILGNKISYRRRVLRGEEHIFMFPRNVRR